MKSSTLELSLGKAQSAIADIKVMLQTLADEEVISVNTANRIAGKMEIVQKNIPSFNDFVTHVYDKGTKNEVPSQNSARFDEIVSLLIPGTNKYLIIK